MLRKHAHIKVSRIRFDREISMSHAKQPPSAHPPSPGAVVHLYGRHDIQPPPYATARSPCSRRIIPAIAFQLTVDAFRRFAVDAAAAGLDLLLAIFSWILAEFLAGCATYAQAMYPLPLPANPGLDHENQQQRAPGRSATASASVKPILTVIPGTKRSKLGKQPPRLPRSTWLTPVAIGRRDSGTR
jgi:hypothetical protein